MEHFGWNIDWRGASSEFQAEVQTFQREWADQEPVVWVQTSGSTGKPKPMQVEKTRMMASAGITLSFLGIGEGSSALLCLPVKYIAGKMMMVRAWVGQLALWVVTPSSHPLAGLKEAPDFAAMIPMQVSQSLSVKQERECLQEIRQLIIGGGAIDPQLEAELRDFPHAVWSTYGMTETLSHVALRRLNGQEASEWYQPFEGVEVRLSEEQTLIIHAPHVCAQDLQTNDRAEINAAGHFRILGRKDNVVNSGGVKIQIEQLEEVIRSVISLPFLVTAASDQKLGEVAVLMLDRSVSESEASDTYREAVTACKEKLPKYWYPNRMIQVDELPMTETGKPDRFRARQLADL